MTSPSRRKLPITRRNTPVSISVSPPARAARAAGYGRLGSRSGWILPLTLVTLVSATTAVRAADRFDRPAAGCRQLPVVCSNQPNCESEACARVDSVPRGARQLAKRSKPSRIVRTNYEPAAQSDPVTVRPFKKIGEIKPFYDYEPDPEAAERDRCGNLCPRPGEGACPDCEPEESAIPGSGKPICPECPRERELQSLLAAEYPARNFAHIHYCWEPTNLYHQPLYFEDHCLERYGHTRHFLIQPFFSAGLFAAQFVGLPYQMSIDPVCKKRYVLGWRRPGEFVPYQYYQVPWNTEAALTEAAVITGAYFLWAPSVTP